ncbi:MAG: DegT/DnrJ/EryC1/StrS family aminotransferase [Thermoleophilia bacterium]
MSQPFIPFSPPCLDERESAAAAAAIESGWLTTGPRASQFEDEFAAYLGSPAALAVSSGTDAMQVALAALGVGPGDEVITSTMTFCSTAHVIEHVGATPVLADVEPKTLNIDRDSVAKAITPRTKALLPVHLYGHPCDMAAIWDLATEHGFHVVEDAAHALPARHGGRLVGSADNFAAFSFYATKNLTTGEGGMLTGSEELIERARPWVLHGMSRDAHARYTQQGSWFYDVTLPGFKCNMTDVQAAIGLEQLRKLPSFQERRGTVAAQYQRAFADIDAIETPVVLAGEESSWHLYVIRLRLEYLSIDRDRFIEELGRRGIGSSVHFIPVHMHSYYRNRYGYEPDSFPVAHANFKRIVTLPLHPGLSDSDVGRVVEAVTEIATQNGK